MLLIIWGQRVSGFIRQALLLWCLSVCDRPQLGESGPSEGGQRGASAALAGLHVCSGHRQHVDRMGHQALGSFCSLLKLKCWEGILRAGRASSRSVFPRAHQQRALRVLCTPVCPHLTGNTLYYSLPNSWVPDNLFCLHFLNVRGRNG